MILVNVNRTSMCNWVLESDSDMNKVWNKPFYDCKEKHQITLDLFFLTDSVRLSDPVLTHFLTGFLTPPFNPFNPKF